MIDRTMSILMVDDSDDDILLATRALEKTGLTYNLVTLSSVQDAIRFFQGEDDFSDRGRFPLPDLMFLDLHMPVADGFDLLQWLLDNPPPRVFPKIIFSASAEDQDVKKAYSLGATAYLMKPCSLNELEGLMRMTHLFWAECRFPQSEHAL